ncbi:MAG: hypothetical protein U0892_12310 [Pirellulales bacterium]
MACPLCSALSDPIRTELSTCSYAVLATCIQSADRNSELPLPLFRIERNLVGTALKPGDVLRVYSSRDYQVGDKSLLLGIGAMPDTEWGPSAPISRSAVAYIDEILSMLKQEHKLDRPLPTPKPAEKADQRAVEPSAPQPVVDETLWLNFFWRHLESDDSWVRDDCFNAVAGISLEAMSQWVGTLKANDVTARIENSATAMDHRRFYWVVLSLCGKQSERDFARRSIFRTLNRTEEERTDAVSDLDAAISCFIGLGGEEALTEIETEILNHPGRRYSERCAAVSAIRVQATEFKKLDRSRLCRSLALALNDPDIADLVIPDLARQEDWSQISRMMQLYRSADKEHQYLRVPIVNYLRTCPLPEAAMALEECRTTDPDAYRRATILFPRLSPGGR